MDQMPILNFNLTVPGSRIMSQIALNEELIKKIVGEAVQKAFYELHDRESEFYKEIVNLAVCEAKTEIRKVTQETVNKQIREHYAKEIKDIVSVIGTDMLADFIKNFDSDLRRKLSTELSFYKK